MWCVQTPGTTLQAFCRAPMSGGSGGGLWARYQLCCWLPSSEVALDHPVHDHWGMQEGEVMGS